MSYTYGPTAETNTKTTLSKTYNKCLVTSGLQLHDPLYTLHVHDGDDDDDNDGDAGAWSDLTMERSNRIPVIRMISV